MNPRANYVIVGVFVIIMTTLTVFGALWLTSAVEDKTYVTYVVYMYESVSGLNENSDVSYKGVDVGRVTDITLDPENPEYVRVLLEIEDGTPVTVDTVAILRTQGITGLANIELSGGTADSDLLVVGEGDEYPEIQTGPSLFVRLDQAVTTIIDQLTDTAKHVDQVATRVEMLLSDENQAAISSTLTHVEVMTANIATQSNQLESLVNRVDRILINAENASGELPALVAEGHQLLSSAEDALTHISGAADGVDGAAGALGETAVTADRAILGIQDDLAAFTHNTPAQVEALIYQLRRVSESLSHLSQDLEHDPNILIWGHPQPQPGPGERGR